MSKLILLLAASVIVSAPAQAKTYSMDVWNVTNIFSPDPGINYSITANDVEITGSTWTVTGITIDTSGVAGIDYRNGTWVFDAVAGTISVTSGQCRTDPSAAFDCTFFDTGSVKTGYTAVGVSTEPIIFFEGSADAAPPYTTYTWVFNEMAVPVPGAVCLFGSALIGLVGIKRKK